jgi:site-specific recombinase XerC
LALLAGGGAPTKLIPPVDLRARFAAYFAERKMKPASEKDARRSIEMFLKFAEDNGLSPESKQAASGFKDSLIKREIGKGTLNNHIGRVSAFLNYCPDHGYVEANPAKAVRMKTKGTRAAKDEREAVPTDLLWSS